MRDPLDIIEYAESKGKNVPNYKYGPGFTAQGYYQITNPTWRDFAKAAGVDLSQYPTAMSAPKEVQRAVAEQIYKRRGFQPWKAVEHLRGQEKNYSVGGQQPSHDILPPAATATPTQTVSSNPTAPRSGSLAGAMGRAMSFNGMNETANRDVLGKFMAEKGIPFTPQNVAWCARFVNATLAEQGLPTTGSNMARSFLKWGQATTTPQQGDIAVFTRGDPRAATGHVGFYGGTVDRNGQQYIRVFGGNQGGPAKGGGEAGWTELPASRLLGYRTNGTGGGPVVASAGTANVKMPAQAANVTQGALAERPAVQQLTPEPQPQLTPPPAPPPEPDQPAPPMMPAPVDYAALMLPRIRRGLLSDDNPYSLGLLGIA